MVDAQAATFAPPGRGSDVAEDGVLEADAERLAASLSGTLTSSEEAIFEKQFESQLVLDAAQLEKADDGPLQSLREADQLGSEAMRGLEAELAREEDGEREVSDRQATDLYERQLESEIEDHLIELRLKERHDAAAKSVGSTIAAPIVVTPDEIPGTKLPTSS